MRQDVFGEVAAAIRAARNAGVIEGHDYADPRKMLRYYEGATSNVRVWDSTSTSRTLAVAAGWTEMAIRGVAVDTNFSAGVKKTILTSAVPTLLYNAVGPAGAAGDTQTWEIIVDGVTYTLPTTPAMVAAGRSCLGTWQGLGVFTNASSQFIPYSDLAVVNGWARIVAGGIAYLMPQEAFANIGLPCLYARQSLTVSVTVSANITGTANQERQSGCSFRTLT